jgi:putative membrane protein
MRVTVEARRGASSWQDARVVSFAIKVVVNAVAIWVATVLLDGVRVEGGQGSTSSRVLTYLFIGLLFGIVNAIVKPVVKVLAFPFYIVTLGLFTFVVNALMLELTAWLSGHTRLTLSIDHFWWTAVWAALIVTVVSLLLDAVLPDPRD